MANKYGLPLNAKIRWISYFILFSTAVVSYPFSLFLNKILGEEAGAILSKNQMKRLFEQYETQKLIKPSERKMLSAALELKFRKIEDVMTPLEKVFMIDINSNLDAQTLKRIYSEGYSRIPVFEKERENIVGLLMARDLVLIQLDSSILTLR